MTAWIERYRREAEERYQRLDAVLAAMDDSTARHGTAEGSSIMTTTTPPQTQVNADPDLPAIEIVRDFNAPVAAVFRAHTEADLVTGWDARTAPTGYVHTAPDGDEYRFFGAFHEVRTDERIVQTFTYEGFPDGVSLETATFEDLGDGRTRLTVTSVLDSMEARDGMISSGMESGLAESYERLGDLLTAGSENADNTAAATRCTAAGSRTTV